MAGNPQRPDLAKLLPDTIHRPTEPGSVLLRLETTRSREGALDGP